MKNQQLRLQEYSESKIVEVVNFDFPEFVILSVRPVEVGLDNFVAEINNEYIFRFPRSGKEAQIPLEVEIEILQHLADQVSFEIPSPLYVGIQYEYAGYRKIVGKTLDRELFTQLSLDQKHKLAFDIATFTHELHVAISETQATTLGIQGADFSHYLVGAEGKLRINLAQTDLWSYCIDVLEQYSQIREQRQDQTFIHWDLHHNNVIMDPVTKKLVGFIDFSDCAVGDYHLDLYAMYRLDLDFMEMVASAYAQISNFSVSSERLLLYAAINEVAYLVELANSPLSNRYLLGLKRLTELQKRKVAVLK